MASVAPPSDSSIAPPLLDLPLHVGELPPTNIESHRSIPDRAQDELVTSKPEGDSETLDYPAVGPDSNGVSKTEQISSLSLGSLLEIKLGYICATSPADTKFVTDILLAGGKAGVQKISLCVRLVLVGGEPQRTAVSAFVKAATTHCGNQTCVQVHNEVDGPIKLRFELGPDVMTNEHPQLLIEMRSRVSHKWRASAWIALTCMLKMLSLGVDYQYNLPLLDDEERICGQLNVSIRGGMQSNLLNENYRWTTVANKREACVITLKVTSLISSGGKNNDIPCFARIWSSMTGKGQAQTIESLVWRSNFMENMTQCVSFKVVDMTTEIIFVGIYRFSTRERNELLGFGSFILCDESFLPTQGSDENASIEQSVSLFPERTRRGEKCGLIILELRKLCDDSNGKKEDENSLAATALGNVAYSTESGDMRCRFDVNVIEARCLPSSVSERDKITIKLQIAQSNWKTELTSVKTVVGIDGTKVAEINDNAHTVVCWSAKDRAFPVLEISLYAQPQKQTNQTVTASKISLKSGKPTKRRMDWRKSLKSNKQASEAITPILVGTGCLNLSSFFSQLHTWVPVEIELAINQQSEPITSREGEKTTTSTRVRLNLRASSCQESGNKSPISMEILNLAQQPVKGDVCIHLLKASGSFLRRAGSLAMYYVSITSGPEVVTSRCCEAEDTQTLTWNEQFALPVASSAPPIIHLSVHQRSIGTEASAEQANMSTSDHPNKDQLIGYLSLPIFPSILKDNHLLQFELPLGMPMELESVTRGKEPSHYKRGLLTLEMQFISHQEIKLTSDIPKEALHLIIHQVRGKLKSSDPALICSSDLARSVFVDVSLMTDRSGVTENLAVGTTGVILLSESGETDVGEVIDLSNHAVAAILSENRGSVLVGKIRDLSGNCYGRVHLPLRSGWRERLVLRKKQGWYPICTESTDAGVIATKDALLMSLQTQDQRNQALPTNSLGKFYVSVREAVLDYFPGLESSSRLKLGNYGGANVELMCPSSNPSNTGLHFRTRQSSNQDNDYHWRWEDDWFPVPYVNESDKFQEVQFSLCIGTQSKQPLTGTFNLISILNDAELKRLDQWIILSDHQENEDIVGSAHLHLVITFVPTIIGTLCVEFGESHVFSESYRRLRIETSFFKCTVQDKSYSTNVAARDTTAMKACQKQLRMPFDSRLNEGLALLPEFSIQWVAVTKTLGEICLGVFTIDLLSIADHRRLTPTNLPDSTQNNFTWCEFLDKSDRTRTSGIISLRFEFYPTRETLEKRSTTSLYTIQSRVASAEIFAIWKKLFYLLDQNGNGVIDRKEFTDVFAHHLEGMSKTSDGRKLLQLLFVGDNQLEEKLVPTQHQITALFSTIDTNSDDEIEWAEYLRFLQQRQRHVYASSNNEESPGQGPEGSPEIRSPRIEQARELRKKTREDRCAASYEGPENQTESPLRLQRKSAPSRLSQTLPREQNVSRLYHSTQEQIRLQQQVASLESILALERRRYAELAAERQTLQRSYQQLHLKHQNDMIQEQTKAKWMKQTIERQQQQLVEREVIRQKHNDASIVLQSTVRSRLELKRFHGLKFRRANAAITIQCMARRIKARKKLCVLREMDAIAKQRNRAALLLQRFVRYNLHRKEQALLQEARLLSATILQKTSRRLLASNTWKRQKLALLRLQCWIRQRFAIRHVAQIRGATAILKTVLLGWMVRWQYKRIHRGSQKLQRWWRRVSKQRSAFLELLEAVLCIQSAWKRRQTRIWFKNERERQDRFIAQIEASICIQAAWRGRRYRLHSARSLEVSPRLVNDSPEDVFAATAGDGDESIPRLIVPNEVDASNELRASHEMNITSSKPSGIPVVIEYSSAEEAAVILKLLTDILEKVVKSTASDMPGDSTSAFDIQSSPRLKKELDQVHEAREPDVVSNEHSDNSGENGVITTPENWSSDPPDQQVQTSTSISSDSPDLDIPVICDVLKGLVNALATTDDVIFEDKYSEFPEFPLSMTDLLPGTDQLKGSRGKPNWESKDFDPVDGETNVENEDIAPASFSNVRVLPEVAVQYDKSSGSEGADDLKVLGESKFLPELPDKAENASDVKEPIQSNDESDVGTQDYDISPHAASNESATLDGNIVIYADDHHDAKEIALSTDQEGNSGECSDIDSSFAVSSKLHPETHSLDRDINIYGDQASDASQGNDDPAAVEQTDASYENEVATNDSPTVSDNPEWDRSAPLDPVQPGQDEHDSDKALHLTSQAFNEDQDDLPRGMFEDDKVAPSISPIVEAAISTARSSVLDSGRSESRDNESDDGGSSIDSSDLMMEANAMVTVNDAASEAEVSIATTSKHPRKTKRLDSSVLLADFRQLDSQSNSENPLTSNSNEDDMFTKGSNSTNSVA